MAAQKHNMNSQGDINSLSPIECPSNKTNHNNSQQRLSRRLQSFFHNILGHNDGTYPVSCSPSRQDSSTACHDANNNNKDNYTNKGQTASSKSLFSMNGMEQSRHDCSNNSRKSRVLSLQIKTNVDRRSSSSNSSARQYPLTPTTPESPFYPLGLNSSS